MNRYLVALALAVTPALAAAQDSTASFVDTEGTEVGTAQIQSTPNGILFTVEVSGLPAQQWVAFHIHETGECDHETSHDSAGGHFNPGGVEHGYLSETGPHAGDMPNLWVDAEGVARAQVMNTMVSTEGDNSIAGRALMIHAGEDDYSSQPTGDAGARLACAVIE